MTHVNAWAAFGAGEPLKQFTYELADPGEEEVEVEVTHCGVCHTDLVFIDNEWGMTPYPFVPGHEIVGRITRLGSVAASKGLSIGQTVGIGWNKESCLHCNQCFSGDSHLCDSAQGTIMHGHGGFGSHLKTHWHWAIPVPSDVAAEDAGPLFCAGITVFSPLLEYNIRPTDRVGVFGIGGLGHLALQFSKAWGADTVAFSSSNAKQQEIEAFGASAMVSSTDPLAWAEWQGKFDLIVITSFSNIDMDQVLGLLAPKGRVHVVGLIGGALSTQVPSLLMKAKQLSSSPVGSRAAIGEMLRFAGRHGIKAKTEHFPMSRVNDAVAHLRSGKANYRVVLDVAS